MTDAVKLMAEWKGGGPAFPSSASTGPDGQSVSFFGMTVRDYFMAHAPFDIGHAAQMLGLDFDQLGTDTNRAMAMGILTLMRREYADAMLKERLL